MGKIVIENESRVDLVLLDRYKESPGSGAGYDGSKGIRIRGGEKKRIPASLYTAETINHPYVQTICLVRAVGGDTSLPELTLYHENFQENAGGRLRLFTELDAHGNTAFSHQFLPPTHHPDQDPLTRLFQTIRDLLILPFQRG